MCKIFFKPQTKDLVSSIEYCSALSSAPSESKSTIGQEECSIDELGQEQYEAVMKWFHEHGVQEGNVEVIEQEFSCKKWNITHTIHHEEKKKCTLGEKRLHHKLKLMI